MKKTIAVLAIFTSLFFAGCITKTATKPTETQTTPGTPATTTETKTPEIPAVTADTKTPTTPEAPALKTYEGTGFTFTYPAKYTSDSVGLWTEEGYENHINPPAGEF